jgi:hypothetical protein
LQKFDEKVCKYWRKSAIVDDIFARSFEVDIEKRKRNRNGGAAGIATQQPHAQRRVHEKMSRAYNPSDKEA